MLQPNIELATDLPPLTLTVSQACKATGLSRTTIYELLGTGRLKSMTVGRRRLISYGSLRELLTPQTT